MYIVTGILYSVYVHTVDRYGAITSVRSLPDKFCAFVNFKNKKSAAQALVGLQVSNVELELSQSYVNVFLLTD